MYQILEALEGLSSWLVGLLHCWGSASGHSITIAYISMHTLAGCILPALEDCTMHAHWGPHYPLSSLAQSGIWALYQAYKVTSGWQSTFPHPFYLEKYLLRLGLFIEPQKILRAGLCGVRYLLGEIPMPEKPCGSSWPSWTLSLLYSDGDLACGMPQFSLGSVCWWSVP